MFTRLLNGPLFDEAGEGADLGGTAVATPPPAAPAPAPTRPLSIHEQLNAASRIPGEPVPEEPKATAAPEAVPPPGDDKPPAEAAPATPTEKSPLDDIDPDLISFDDDEDAPPAAEASPDTPPAEGAESKPPTLTDEELETQLRELSGKDFASDPQLGDKIQDAFLRTSRGRRMLGAFKTLRDLGAPPDENGQGGLGFVPTAEEIKEMHSRATAHERFVRDLDDPQRLPEVMNFLLGTRDQPAANAVTIAQNLPRYLAINNPPALQRLETTVLNAKVAQMRQLEQSATDPGLKRYYGQMANGIEYLLNPKAAAKSNGAAAAPPQVEENEELIRLRRERAALEQERNQIREAQYAEFQQDFVGEASQAVAKLFQKGLGIDVVETYGEVLAPYMQTRIQEVLAGVLKPGSDFEERITQRVNDAFTKGSPQERDRALQELRRYAEPYVRNQIRKIQTDLRGRAPKTGAKAQADAQRAAYQQQQENSAPEGGGAPSAVPPGSNGFQAWDPSKEDHRSYMMRQLNSIGAPPV